MHKFTLPSQRICATRVPVPSCCFGLAIALERNVKGYKNMPVKRSASRSQSRGKGKIEKVMHEYKHGELKSGRGGKVKSRKQAVAIALNEARKSGARVP